MMKLHHLKRSRSTRIIWLLEELGRPYELVSYDRQADGFAPAELRRMHPLCKAPILEDGEVRIAESGAIVEYVVTAHGEGRLRPAGIGARWAAWIEWLHVAEGSAAMPIQITFLGGRTGGLTEQMSSYLATGVRRTLDHIGATVERHGYLLEEGFSSADIQMFYVLELARMGDMLGSHPAVGAYLDRIEARPAFRRAIEIGGPVPLLEPGPSSPD